MTRFLTIFNLLIALICLACSSQRQQPNQIGNVEELNNLLKTWESTDSVHRDSLITLHLNNVKELDSLLQDSSIAKILLKQGRWDSGEFAATTYTSTLPPLPASQVMDMESVFTRRERNILSSVISGLKNGAKQSVIIVSLKDDWSAVENFDKLVLAMHRSWAMQKQELCSAVVIGINTQLKKTYISNAYQGKQWLSQGQIATIENNMNIGFSKGEYFHAVHDALKSIGDSIQ